MIGIEIDSDGLFDAFRAGNFSAAKIGDLRPLSVIWEMIGERLEVCGVDIPFKKFATHSTPNFSGLLEATKAVEDCCSNFINTDFDYSLSYFSEFPKFWTIYDIRSSEHPMNRFPPPGSTDDTENALELYIALLGDMYFWLKKCQLILAKKVVATKRHVLTNEGTIEEPDYRWDELDLSPPYEYDNDDIFYILRAVDKFSIREYSEYNDQEDEEGNDLGYPIHTNIKDETKGFIQSGFAVSNGYYRPIKFFPVWRLEAGIYSVYSSERGSFTIGGDGTMADAPGEYSSESFEFWRGLYNDGINGLRYELSFYNVKGISSSGNLTKPDGNLESFVSMLDDGDSYKIERLKIFSPDWTKNRDIDARRYPMASSTWEDQNVGSSSGDDVFALVSASRFYSITTNTPSTLIPGPGPDLSRMVEVPANSSGLVIPEVSNLPKITRPSVPNDEPTPSKKYPLCAVLAVKYLYSGPYSAAFVGDVSQMFSIKSFPPSLE